MSSESDGGRPDSKDLKITITPELIQSLMSEKGGWSKAALEVLGVDWPPQSGWKSKIRGKQVLASDLVKLGLTLLQIDGMQLANGARGPRQAKTTEIGYKNPNGQTVICKADRPGNDHMQLTYELECGTCGNRYGSNGSDNFQRRCPNCQGGRPGLPI